MDADTTTDLSGVPTLCIPDPHSKTGLGVHSLDGRGHGMLTRELVMARYVPILEGNTTKFIVVAWS